jgi:polygalacturonase/pectin methylesterase-like acyl-CoA thioesterase
MMRVKLVAVILSFFSAISLRGGTRTISVATDGSGDFKDLQAAIDAVPAQSGEAIVIHIKPGVYKQRVEVPKDKPGITLRGDDAKTTVLTCDWNSHTKGADGKEIGTFLSYSTLVAANNFTAENITFENTAGDHGQALAISVTGDRETFRHCRFLGWQDTVYINDGRDYFADCYIEGRVDFIFGNATAVFERCLIHSKNNPDNSGGGYLTTADTKPSTQFGFVFLDCTATGEGKPTYLGRPWRWYEGSKASVTFIRTKMGPHIVAAGWNKWDQKGNPDTQPATVTRYAEFGSMDLAGKALDVSQRVEWSRQLSAEEAAKYTVENILGGEDQWNPNSTPSPGTPGEGGGEGTVSSNNGPHPNPLPEYSSTTLTAGQGRGQYNVRDFGAVPDGQTNDTAKLQAAIDACGAGGGGTVVVPPGNYVTGTLWMRSNVTLDIESGATLLGSQNAEEYPQWTSQWEGKKAVGGRAAMICGEGLENVSLVGHGVIDARGQFWWDMAHKNRDAVRPLLFRVVDSKHVHVSGLTFKNSPMWTISPLACEDVSIDGIDIENPVHSPNTDGIDPDSCNNVHVSNCTISVGDDCVAIKSGTEMDGRAQHTPCENITFTNCTMFHGHAGIALGSETSGWIRNVVISNCVFVGTDRGLRFKSRRGRGGGIEDVSADNIIMDGVLCPIAMNLFYAPGAAKGDKKIAEQDVSYPVDESTPRFRRFRFSNISAKNAQYAAAFLLGLPEMPIDDVTFQNVSLYMDVANTKAGTPEMAPGMKAVVRAGFLAANVTNLRLADSVICGQLSSAILLNNVRGATLSEVRFLTSTSDPLVALRNSRDVYFRGCAADQMGMIQDSDEKMENVHLDESDVDLKFVISHR